MEYGAVIRVTPKMRSYLGSQGIHLRKETETLRIPARPFIEDSTKEIESVAEQEIGRVVEETLNGN